MSAAQGADRQSSARGDSATQQKGDAAARRAQGSTDAPHMLAGGAHPMEDCMSQTQRSHRSAAELGCSWCRIHLLRSIQWSLGPHQGGRCCPGHVAPYTRVTPQPGSSGAHQDATGWQRDAPAALSQLWAGLHTEQHRFPATPHPAVL